MKTNTYTYGVTDELIQLVGFDAAVLACRLPAFEKDGKICVSFEFLATLWNVDSRTIKAAARRLQNEDVWTFKAGSWKGSPTEWLKGTKFDTFIHSQRVQNLRVKGTKNVPNNKDTIKNNNHRVMVKDAPARVTNPTSKEKIMTDFEQFWQAFFFGSYAQYEAQQRAYYDRAATLFETLSDDKRAALLRDIKAGKRYDKSHYVLWYIQNYQPGDRRGLRLTRDQYYRRFETDAVLDGWKFYKPEGYDRFIYEKL